MFAMQNKVVLQKYVRPTDILNNSVKIAHISIVLNKTNLILLAL